MVFQYGNWLHIGEVLLALLSVGAAYLILKGRTKKTQDTVVFLLMLLNVLQHLCKHLIWRWPHETFGVTNTAYNLCALMILLSPLVYFTKGAIRDFVSYMGVIGGFGALVYPMWFQGHNILTLEWARFYTCHLLLLITSVLPYLLGRHKPRFGHIWWMGPCFVTSLLLINVNLGVVYSIEHKAGFSATWDYLAKNNRFWMFHTPKDGGAWVSWIQTATPDFLEGIPVLWCLVPLLLGVTLAAFLLGCLLDRPGYHAFRKRWKWYITKRK